MKRSFSFLILALASFAVLYQAEAQSVTQQVSISFPNKAAIAVSGNPSTLQLTTVDAQTGTWTSVSDNSTTLYQVNNYGTPGAPLKITAQFATDLTTAAPGLALSLQAGGTGGQNVDLSDGGVKDLVTGLTKGFSSHNLTYTLSATSAAGAYSLTNETVTLTVTN
jgi:hypothetical protein